MTEDDWITATDTQPMLLFLQSREKASERRLRLFAVACCRRVWHLLADERSRRAVEAAERSAEGESGGRQERAASRAASRLRAENSGSFAWMLDPSAWAAAELVAGRVATEAANSQRPLERAPADPVEEKSWYSAWWQTEYQRELRLQSALLRDIFGPLPLRPVTLPRPSGRGTTAPSRSSPKPPTGSVCSRRGNSTRTVWASWRMPWRRSVPILSCWNTCVYRGFTSAGVG